MKACKYDKSNNMRKLFKNIYEYLKSIFQEWYWFLGLVPSLLDNISLYLPPKYHFAIPSQYTSSYLLVAFFVVSYRIWANAKQKIKEPKVIIDYDLSSFNICYLYIKNIGSSHAKNIQTIFTPNVEIGENCAINDSNFCKNLNQLAPGQSVRFFFGAFTDKKILQQFDIRITYFDLESGEKYTSEQIIDPSTFIGTSPQESESKIVKELKEITSSLKKLADNADEIPKAIKSGINIRNIDLEDLSENELRTLLHNIYLYGSNEDFWLNPFINDTRQIIKCLRNKIMIRENISDVERIFLDKLNAIHNYQPHIGSGDEFKEKVQNLFKENTNS